MTECKEFVVSLEIIPDSVDVTGRPIENYRLTSEPIVRCRDCKNAYEVNDTHLSKQGKLDCGHFAQWDYYDDQPGIWLVEPDGFCKWGEKRD